MMMCNRWDFFKLIVIAPILIFSGCATVPKEVVELSYNMGKDLQEVHKSYKGAIHEQFEGFRSERLAYFEKEWKPRFIEKWVQDGRLIDIASGQVVWSKTEKSFVTPIPSQQKEDLLNSINSWARSAIKQLDAKKKSLMDPLDVDEAAIMVSIDDSFNQLYRANAAITAHLNSLRKVQEVQTEMLSEVKGDKIRDQVDTLLVAASEKAKSGLEEMKKADKLTDKLDEILPEKK